MRRAIAYAVLALTLPVLSALAGSLDVAFDGDRVTIRADDAPLSAVLERLRGRVNLIFDEDLHHHVTVTAEAISVPDALRILAAAGGADFQEAKGPIYLVRKRREGLPRIVLDKGLYFARPAIDYPVEVLQDAPADVSRKAALVSFESTGEYARPGVSLMSAPSLKATVLREYLEARAVYRAITARAGDPMPMPESVDDRQVRLYVSEVEDRYYAEILITDSERREVVHLVYRMEPKTLRVEILSLFRQGIARR